MVLVERFYDMVGSKLSQNGRLQVRLRHDELPILVLTTGRLTLGVKLVVTTVTFS
jgi:hypothetical protein